jgi:histidinol phosphatase-like enzyme (inositol monophosphatase family)
MDETARDELDRLIGFAHRLADLSGGVILPRFRMPQAMDDKSSGGAFDPVTEADRGAERVMREEISRHFPEHGIIGEEYGVHNPAADVCWTLDPIDGTRSFIMGLPIWGTLIGLSHHGRPIIGVMDQPFMAERFWGDGTTSYYRRGSSGVPEPLRVSGCSQLGQAMVATTTPDMFRTPREQEALAALGRATRLMRYGGDCYNYCLLAMGHVDIVMECGLKSFDIAPLMPIIEGAGGRVSSWAGADAAGGGCVIATANPTLHQAALALLGPFAGD